MIEVSSNHSCIFGVKRSKTGPFGALPSSHPGWDVGYRFALTRPRPPVPPVMSHESVLYEVGSLVSSNIQVNRLDQG